MRLGRYGGQLALNIARMKLGSHVTKAGLCCALTLIVTMAHSGEVAGVSLPEVVSVAGKELRLNGRGVLKKAIFFKVYVVGLYLEEPTTDAQVAIANDEGKGIFISMLRDVSRKKFINAVEAAIMLNSGPSMPTLRARLDLLEHALPALKKGDELDFTYLPGDGTLMRCHGQELTISGKDFADALFSAWLGPKPVNAALKRDLLAGH